MTEPFSRRLARRALRTALAAPETVLRRLVGPAPRSDRGHALDLEVQVLLRLMVESRLPAEVLGVGRMRHDYAVQGPIVDFPPDLRVRVEERRAEGPGGPIPLRVYRPTGVDAGAAACVYFHGGGFVLGGLESHDGLCQALAARAGCVLVSVDYRLAPEHRFPAAPHDALAAFAWVAAHADALGIDARRIAVAGDSAGGNLAAVVSQQTRGAAHRPCLQVLIYPATDLTRSEASHRRFSQGFLLDEALLDWFVKAYLRTPERELRDPLASPLFATDLTGLPPAHVVTAGFDPLRDEGEAYADALAEAGAVVTRRCEESLIHGFFSMGGVLRTPRAAFERVAVALGEGLAAAR